ncbi:hypothetical protein SAMN06265795_13216 [Noviherbaspirillum humi]|uniref:DUF2272 domain-containing protein n=1 Tax=Noviherbaspirillum humi TaxID=1688639 RepID=A0A239M6V8_9BURK|nr:DUF2272 domain-containing protein [Noviherbaspirillum humi]SNT37882.1 hypothetical protein SAMN06265795_13216 [Noviherbaspirillum humi]
MRRFAFSKISSLFFILPLTALANNDACDSPGEPSALGQSIANAALKEYREFSGHRIDAEGRLVKFGSVESEAEPLIESTPGMTPPDRFAWRRVWEYWRTLEKHASDQSGELKISYLPGLLDDRRSAGRPREAELRQLLSGLDALAAGPMGAAAREAAVRTALNDTPWSAAFISYVMHQSGMPDAAFRYSATHADYIKRAFDAPEGYAYRACDPYRTRPRGGDLLCYARGSQPLRGFDAWRKAARAPGFITPAHCDLVIHVDQAARKADVVGGNVLQSITLRRLKLNDALALSRSHAAPAKAEKEPACTGLSACPRQNFNSQHWGVLLQLVR